MPENGFVALLDTIRAGFSVASSLMEENAPKQKPRAGVQFWENKERKISSLDETDKRIMVWAAGEAENRDIKRRGGILVGTDPVTGASMYKVPPQNDYYHYSPAVHAFTTNGSPEITAHERFHAAQRYLRDSEHPNGIAYNVPFAEGLEKKLAGRDLEEEMANEAFGFNPTANYDAYVKYVNHVRASRPDVAPIIESAEPSYAYPQYARESASSLSRFVPLNTRYTKTEPPPVNTQRTVVNKIEKDMENQNSLRSLISYIYGR